MHECGYFGPLCLGLLETPDTLFWDSSLFLAETLPEILPGPGCRGGRVQAFTNSES